MHTLRIILLLLIIVAPWESALAQSDRIISGRVTDAPTQEPVPYASVAVKGTTTGAITDFDGRYTIQLDSNADSLTVSCIGYISRSKAIDSTAPEQEINFQLVPGSVQLKEFTISSGENPAFAIIRKVVSNKSFNNPEKQPAYQYESYNRIQIDMDKLSEKFRKKKTVQKITGLIEQYDAIKGEDGETVIPLFISESVSDYYFRSNPEKKKEIVHKTKLSGITVTDGGLISQLIGSSFQQYNFYNNWLRILEKDFSSPITDNWKVYYNYFLDDSVFNGTNYDYKIEFWPKNQLDLAFTGTMWITGDTYAVSDIVASVSNKGNINYVEQLRIQQQYASVDSTWLPAKTRVIIDVEEAAPGTAGMIIKFYSSNSNFKTGQPLEPSFYDTAIELKDDFKTYEKDYWEKKRPENLSETEKLSFQVIDSLKNTPALRTYIEIINLFVYGYKNLPRWNIDLGPYLYTYAFNTFEGHRIRLGFRTDPDFSRKWVFSGYAAYGTGDGEFKYGAAMQHIFSRKPWTVGGISYSHDVERMGITKENIGSSTIFGAFSRFGNFRRPYFQNDISAFIKREVTKGLTHKITLRRREFDPKFPFYYKTNPAAGDESPLKSEYETTELVFETRLARKETFLQNDNDRISIGNGNAPVFGIRYTLGLKHVFGSDFAYHKLETDLSQTFRLGIWGRSLYQIQLGYIPSTLPYPLLYSPLGNESLIYVPNAFNLMNFFEFISDRYVTARFEHSDEGMIFNRIPMVKKLKLRLVFSGRVYYGQVSNRNLTLSPATDPSGNTIPGFTALGRKPYIEVGYGINNILRVGRVDFIHRLSYRDHPDVSKFGVKMSFWFNI